jgi:hypothetical protein
MYFGIPVPKTQRELIARAAELESKLTKALLK